MIPKGGKFANAVVNRVHHAVKDWKKFKEAITQIDDLIKRMLHKNKAVREMCP